MLYEIYIFVLFFVNSRSQTFSPLPSRMPKPRRGNRKKLISKNMEEWEVQRFFILCTSFYDILERGEDCQKSLVSIFKKLCENEVNFHNAIINLLCHKIGN